MRSASPHATLVQSTVRMLCVLQCVLQCDTSEKCAWHAAVPGGQAISLLML